MWEHAALWCGRSCRNTSPRMAGRAQTVRMPDLTAGAMTAAAVYESLCLQIVALPRLRGQRGHTVLIATVSLPE